MLEELEVLCGHPGCLPKNTYEFLPRKALDKIHAKWKNLDRFLEREEALQGATWFKPRREECGIQLSLIAEAMKKPRFTVRAPHRARESIDKTELLMGEMSLTREAKVDLRERALVQRAAAAAPHDVALRLLRAQQAGANGMEALRHSWGNAARDLLSTMAAPALARHTVWAMVCRPQDFARGEAVFATALQIVRREGNEQDENILCLVESRQPAEPHTELSFGCRSVWVGTAPRACSCRIRAPS